jgi:hypothetical protein
VAVAVEKKPLIAHQQVLVVGRGDHQLKPQQLVQQILAGVVVEMVVQIKPQQLAAQALLLFVIVVLSEAQAAQ